jgi:hypothetical protein
MKRQLPRNANLPIGPENFANFENEKKKSEELFLLGENLGYRNPDIRCD